MLFQASITAADQALRDAGPTAHFKGVLWDQGEADSLAINRKVENENDYVSALSHLILRFRRHFGKTTPFFIFETGRTNDKDQSGFETVRKAEVYVSKQTPGAPIVFKSAISFPERKLMSKNGVHYNQAGYNIMGREGAEGVASYFSGR